MNAKQREVLLKAVYALEEVAIECIADPTLNEEVSELDLFTKSIDEVAYEIECYAHRQLEKVFEVGKHYQRPGLYSFSFIVTCVGRTETTATFAQLGFEDEDSTTINIINDCGVEACEAWEYRGHRAYIHAEEVTI